MLHGEERRKAVIKENLEEVEQRIQAACRRAGRKREEVTLIAVSKTKPVEDLKEAYHPERLKTYTGSHCSDLFPIQNGTMWFHILSLRVHTSV